MELCSFDYDWSWLDLLCTLLSLFDSHRWQVAFFRVLRYWIVLFWVWRKSTRFIMDIALLICLFLYIDILWILPTLFLSYRWKVTFGSFYYHMRIHFHRERAAYQLYNRLTSVLGGCISAIKTWRQGAVPPGLCQFVGLSLSCPRCSIMGRLTGSRIFVHAMH